MAAPMRFNALTSNSQLFACLMFVLISVKCDNEHADIPKDPNSEDGPLQDSFYSFDARTADGELVELSKYKGMVTLVVNVASECGFTDSHYNGLIRLKNVLGTSGKFEVLAFPCNQFDEQEPKSDTEIQNFVQDVYHVNFPVFAKIDVLGDNVPSSWKFLISSFGEPPNWNFWKYVVNENGQVVNAWGPWIGIEDIFHDVKEVIDNIGYDQPSYSKPKTPKRQTDEL